MADDSRRLDAAQVEPYRGVGLTVIPLHRWNYVDARGKERGKSPRDTDWQRRPYDHGEVVGEAERGGTNVGVRLRPDWVVLDCDPRNYPARDGSDIKERPGAPRRDILFELNMELDLELATAPHVVTGSGGHHYYYRKPADVDLLDSMPDWPGIELKSRGRQVVSAGSVHPCGERYRWAEDSPPLGAARPLPEALLLLARRQQATAGTRGAGEMSLDQLAEALEQLPVEEFREHDRWRDLMMSCHHATAGEGRQEFIDWSTGDPNYRDDAWQVGRRWDSLHHDRGSVGAGGRPITARYLYQQVLARGGHVPIDPPEVDFEAVETAEELDGASLGEAPPTAEAERRTTLEEMNEHNCIVEEEKTRVYTKRFDPLLNRRYYLRRGLADFVSAHENQRVEVPGADGESKAINKGTWWLKQGGRRQYQGVLFDPAERIHEGWLNLWEGWDVQPRLGDWSLLRGLIRDALCDGDEELHRYVMNWMAYMVQHPDRQAEVALVLRGAKGTGKSTFGTALTGLAGRHGMHISSPEHLVGRFNSHLRDCIALFADEAFWAGDKKGESVLKALVTERTLFFEAKGKDGEQGKNLIHLVIASNSDWVVPAGMDRERRFCVAEVNESRVGDREFFRRLHEQMDDGGRAAMLWDLKVRPIGEWSPRDDVPQTRGLVDQKLRSMDMQTSWWYEKLRDGFLPNQRDEWGAGPATVLKEFLRRDFQQYSRDSGWGRAGNETEFGLKMAKLARVIARQATALEGEFGVKTDVRGRAMAYVVPPLADCRRDFEEAIGGRLAWPAAAEGTSPSSDEG